MKIVGAAFNRQAAQRRFLDKIRLKYATRMGFEMRRVMRAIRQAMEIEKEMKKEFADELGDDDHVLHKDATFQPLFTPGFKETKIMAKHVIDETKRLMKAHENTSK